jgi:hypothetical protein
MHVDHSRQQGRIAEVVARQVGSGDGRIFAVRDLADTAVFDQYMDVLERPLRTSSMRAAVTRTVLSPGFTAS